MADNTELDAGTGGDTIASDDIGGIKFQRIKLIYGADGSNAGDVAAANPLPVTASGVAAHDAAASGNPILLGAYAKAAAPTDVSADADAVRLWALLNGALCINITAAGALIGGDATNGLDVDVTRSALPTGASTSAKQDTIIGHVDGIEALLGGTLTVASHAVTNAGTFAVQVDGSALTSLQLIDDVIFVDDTAFTPATSKVAMIGAQADEASTDSVDEGDAGALRMTLNRQLVTTTKPTATGEGCDVFFSIDIDETEEDVKTSAGMLYGYYFANLHATLFRYLRFYNATAANTTVGSTAALVVYPLPPNSAGHVNFTHPVKFDTALCAAATTGVAANDTGAPGANEVVLDVYYK